MDSISQAALGAAVGEAVLGRQIGNRAIVWGVVLGTLPDLDVVVNPLIDQVTQLTWHRGWSHSLLVAAAVSPLLAFGFNRLHRGRATFNRWTLAVMLCLVTHMLLDTFTVYGTQLLMPLTNYGYAWNSVAIIDPLYTIPLLVGVVGALWLRRTNARRFWLNMSGITLSSLYLIWSLGVKWHVHEVSTADLERQQIDYSRIMHSPTIFNTLLWRITVEDGDRLHVAYYSLLDSDRILDWKTINKGYRQITTFADSRAISTLRWFSKDWLVEFDVDGQRRFADLRFGELETTPPQGLQPIFSWTLDTSGTEPMLEQQEPVSVDVGNASQTLITRMLGE